MESLEEEDNELSDEERALLLQDLVGQAERTSDIVKKLLEFSRNRYAKTEIVALESIVQKTADLVQNEMRLNHVKFSQSIIGGPLPGLRVDKGGDPTGVFEPLSEQHPGHGRWRPDRCCHGHEPDCQRSSNRCSRYRERCCTRASGPAV